MTCSIIEANGRRKPAGGGFHQPAYAGRSPFCPPIQTRKSRLLCVQSFRTASNRCRADLERGEQWEVRKTMSRLVPSSLAAWLLVALGPAAAQTTDADPPARHMP